MVPKMDGENKRKPQLKWMIWGENPLFLEPPISPVGHSCLMANKASLCTCFVVLTACTTLCWGLGLFKIGDVGWTWVPSSRWVWWMSLLNLVDIFIYMYIWTYVHMHIWIYVYMYIWTYANICIYEYMYIWMYVNMNVYYIYIICFFFLVFFLNSKTLWQKGGVGVCSLVLFSFNLCHILARGGDLTQPSFPQATSGTHPWKTRSVSKFPLFSGHEYLRQKKTCQIASGEMEPEQVHASI